MVGLFQVSLRKITPNSVISGLNRRKVKVRVLFTVLVLAIRNIVSINKTRLTLFPSQTHFNDASYNITHADLKVNFMLFDVVNNHFFLAV